MWNGLANESKGSISSLRTEKFSPVIDRISQTELASEISRAEKQIWPFAVNIAVEIPMWPVAIAIIFGVLMLAVRLIGFLWVLALLLPFYAYIGAAIYLIRRARRINSRLMETLEREIERQRLLNEQEMRAWRGSPRERERERERERDETRRLRKD
jgi:hypothetical protein